MLKFQEDYSIAQQSFEDFIVAVFVLVDEQQPNDVLIVDSFPEVCKFCRASFCKSFRDEGATYSYNASKKETFFGYKVHAITTSEGVF